MVTPALRVHKGLLALPGLRGQLVLPVRLDLWVLQVLRVRLVPLVLLAL